MLLGILTYRPIFNTFLNDTDVKQWVEGYENFNKKSYHNGIPVEKTELIKGSNDSLKIETHSFMLPDGKKFTAVFTDTIKTNAPLRKFEMGGLGISFANKHLSPGLYWKFIGLVFLLILYVTMVYGPIAAFLVEMFPTKIRYTSMSLPYHIGNGVFGGLVPFIGLLLTTSYPSDPLVGLWYPIGVASLCLVIGIIYLSNKIDKDVTD